MDIRESVLRALDRLAEGREVAEQVHAEPKEVALKGVKPYVTTDTTTTLPYDVKSQRVKLAQFKHLFY